MIAVIFEVIPATAERQRYLDIAADLLERLKQIEGFISVERFQSLSDPDKILSLSFFTDEDAVRRWRISPAHRAGQSEGRAGVFTAYRLRVAHVVRDYTLTDRAEAPDDSRAHHG
ncbi:antibiotic biosynthesis monooxygenase family protein [Pelagibacterium halotolerans]|uniref:Antibiotic biosynthesis monooxygenase n=1 Tax=Pelagibacterium halotolerans (strain DSM 22347 / JCM 15775 / CGMCC 1.7692 / B2) TaxID=1082931 RepID=G4RDA9_PELHB|nr:antibiotic biosynthesis monooxygenase [Pelagibacterium halotolerans]AEQ50735.1 antibiotic biosynthesis monooxygenase [Pelagibacterium halotolerans B2]QJR19343.1 antibiotic biosynthesis monooxygenase [Pelagibacterium halotolerans]SDZ94364.1 Heme-degrading monooxygenase HmoA [Pelagibacterium halotolerans]